MKSYTFDDVVIPHQYRSVNRRCIEQENVRGYDTETIDGKATLLADESEHMHPQSFGDILLWLTSKKRRGLVGFFYNLTYDMQAILKWLYDSDETHLWMELHRKQRIDYGPFHIFYLKGKMLSIKREKPSGKINKFVFYDISQFYGKRRLEDVAQEYLGEGKKEHTYDLARLTMGNMYQTDFIAYCKRDAYCAGELARLWLRICRDCALTPSSLASPATVSAQYFAQECKTIPTINAFNYNNLGRNQLRYAWESIKGAYISVFKRGYFPQAWEYDINSAYPASMQTLPDIARGVFVTLSGRKGIPKDAEMGWLKCTVEINRSDPQGYHPCIPMRRDDGINHYPAGSYTTYMTLLEYETLKNDHWIQIESGVYWLPTGTIEYPYEETIRRLYNTRIVTDDPHVDYFCKIMLNGWYGKHLEKHEVLDTDDPYYGKIQTGKYFNPFYASYILAWCRIKVWNKLASIPHDDIIAVSTDSVYTRCPLQIEPSRAIGAWSPSGEGELLMIGSGVYTLRSGDVIKTRNRGFRTTSKLDLFKSCEQTWETMQIEIEQTRALSSVEALIQHRPEDMNKLLTMPRKIDINFDTKRLWHDQFASTDDLLSRWIDSAPPLQY